MKQPTWIVAAVALAAFLTPALAGHGGAAVAVAATPTPAALQYDEINRPVVPPATPPAPGSFQVDYQAITSSQTAGNGAAPKHRGGLGGMLNAVMSGQPPDQGGDPEEMMRRMAMGHLTRYTYYKGWIREDDPVAQTATIKKCDQHQFITLNLAAKTYTVSSTQPPCPTPQMMGPMGRHGGGGGQPGTVDMTFTSTSKNLGPLTIDTVATNGNDANFSMSMTNATGSCHNGQVAMQMTRYISQIGVPRAYCPLPHTMNPTAMMEQMGCKPNIHTNMQGSPFADSGKLVMYSLTRMAAGAQGAEGMPPGAGGFGMLIERGNVKWLSGPPAEALFAIPEGFTQSS